MKTEYTTPGEKLLQIDSELEHRPPKRTLVQQIAYAVAGLTGWKVELNPLLPPKCVIIGAPHTTSLDLFITFLLMAATRLKLCWVAKDTLFWWPLGVLFRKLGGIPVNRRERTNFVEQMVTLFNRSQQMQLAINPAGTRRKTPHWKTGLYYIAFNAKVPIALGFADYRRKVVGIGAAFSPNGNIETDFEIIRTFYAGITGRHPEKQSEITFQRK